MKAAITTRRGLSLEDLIGGVLLIGVLFSAAIIALGLILLILPGTDKRLLLAQLFSEHGVIIAGLPTSFAMVLKGALEGQPVAVIDMGVLLLIFTPVLRVALSAVFFSLHGDRLYALISTVVLALLLLGFALRKIT